jgi:hypothetical protein
LAQNLAPVRKLDPQLVHFIANLLLSVPPHLAVLCSDGRGRKLLCLELEDKGLLLVVLGR